MNDTKAGRKFLQDLQDVIAENKRALDDKEEELRVALDTLKKKRRAFERKCNDTFPELEQLKQAQHVTLTEQEIRLITQDTQADAATLLERCRLMKREHEAKKVYQRVGETLHRKDSEMSVALSSLWNATAHLISDRSTREKPNAKRVAFQ